MDNNEAQKKEDLLLDLYKIHAYIPNDAQDNPLTPFGNFCAGFEAAQQQSAGEIAELKVELNVRQKDLEFEFNRANELDENINNLKCKKSLLEADNESLTNQLAKIEMICSEQKLYIHGLKGECEDMGVTDICVALARKDTLNKELKADNERLQAQINELRGALKDITTADEMGVCDSGYTAIYIARKALSKTPAQCLQEHDNEVIERCAKVADEQGYIRALKGKQNG